MEVTSRVDILPGLTFVKVRVDLGIEDVPSFPTLVGDGFQLSSRGSQLWVQASSECVHVYRSHTACFHASSVRASSV